MIANRVLPVILGLGLVCLIGGVGVSLFYPDALAWGLGSFIITIALAALADPFLRRFGAHLEP